MKNRYFSFAARLLLITLGIAGCSTSPPRGTTPTLSPSNMPRIGTVDERFQSYNVEMVEVTGGRFWKPYGAALESPDTKAATQGSKNGESTPAGMDPNLFQYRAPIDLSNSRLRKLAAALGPSYARVSGTWANTTYFSNSESPAPTHAPSGFSGVLTRAQWKGVVDFSRTVDGKIVTSFATSPGTRNSSGNWLPKQASEFLSYTKSVGGSIAATEFMNEPTYAAMGGAPKGYDAAAYGQDIAAFGKFIREDSPGTIFLGPGSVGEGPYAMVAGGGMLNSEDLLQATGPAFDVFSYHLYAAVSQRCARLGQKSQTSEADALSPEWLGRSEKIAAFYDGLRDKFEPNKDLWITETADTACGGNPWASTFLDSFRYAVQHGSLAQHGVKVIMHNTLASSAYGLVDETTFTPRPNYWTAIVWRKLMGTTVLKPEINPPANVYVYAHCLRNRPGGVAVLVVNADRQSAFEINSPPEAQRYSLTAHQLEDTTIQLNGTSLQLTNADDVPQLSGELVRAGRVVFPPLSITFLAIPSANNASCQ